MKKIIPYFLVFFLSVTVSGFAQAETGSASAIPDKHTVKAGASCVKTNGLKSTLKNHYRVMQKICRKNLINLFIKRST